MTQPKVTMYGADWCGDCRRAKQFFKDYGIEYHWINTDQDKTAEELVKKLNGGRRVIPTILFEDGSMLVEPSNAELANKLGVEL